MLKRHPRTPTHRFLDDAAYFITGIIYQYRSLLNPPQLKTTLLNLVQQTFSQYQWRLDHWVILDNHYHLLGHSHNGGDLPNLMRTIHSRSAIAMRQVTAAAPQFGGIIGITAHAMRLIISPD